MSPHMIDGKMPVARTQITCSSLRPSSFFPFRRTDNDNFWKIYEAPLMRKTADGHGHGNWILDKTGKSKIKMDKKYDRSFFNDRWKPTHHIIIHQKSSKKNNLPTEWSAHEQKCGHYRLWETKKKERKFQGLDSQFWWEMVRGRRWYYHMQWWDMQWPVLKRLGKQILGLTRNLKNVRDERNKQNFERKFSQS